MALTTSEAAFEEFCATTGIPFERIPVGSSRTPDYLVRPYDVRIACEVKQLELNREEKAALESAYRGKPVVIRHTPGSKVRGAINDAAPQLRNFTRGEYPGLLVLLEDSLIPKHTDDYNVRVAMFGLDTVVMGVPEDPRESPFLKDRKSGPKRKVTEEHNTSLSAVAVLRRHDDGSIYCRVYHNPFASAPLPRELLKSRARHFRLREKQPGNFDDWIEI